MLIQPESTRRGTPQSVDCKHAEIVQCQRDQERKKELLKLAIDAACQHHLSCHCRGCFECSKNHSHICGPLCECRCRLPDEKRRRTSIDTDCEGVPWFHWNGEQEEQPLIQMQPKRSKCDRIQNVSC